MRRNIDVKNIATNNTESKRSSRPPCPGRIVPKSLMLYVLFMRDATKSPNCAKILPKNVTGTIIKACTHKGLDSPSDEKLSRRVNSPVEFSKSPNHVPGANTYP